MPSFHWHVKMCSNLNSDFIESGSYSLYSKFYYFCPFTLMIAIVIAAEITVACFMITISP